MSADFQRIKEVFLHVSELPVLDRAAELDRLSDGDCSLRQAVAELLASETQPAAFDSSVISLLRDGLDQLDAVPHTISRYEIVREIGRGGMGTVYEARQSNPQRSVALKLLRPGWATESLQRRFEYETQVLGLLQHAGIAQIYESGSEVTDQGRQFFFAMELVEGKPLTTYACEACLTKDERLKLVAVICDAIHHAHQKGVVHRDLKPANILVDVNGQPKILDFGVARAVAGEADRNLTHTQTGQVIGTLAYMSPEQASGRPGDVDIRSDVYALGVILFELLADRLPFDFSTQDFVGSLQTIRDREAPPLGGLHRGLRGDVETIAKTALAKDKERRYQSAAELAADIRRFLRREPIAARPPSLIYQLQMFAKRNKTLVAAGSLVALTLLAGLITTARQKRAAEAANRTAAERLEFMDGLFQTVNPGIAGRDARVADFLDDWAANLKAETTTDAAGRAELLNSLGNGYYGIAQYGPAIDAFREAVELRAQEFGPQSTQVAESRAQLGTALQRSGELGEALREFEMALRIREERQGKDALPIGEILDHTGVIHWFRSDFDVAVPELRRALAIHQRHLPPDDPLVIMSLHRLATTLPSVNETEEAKALMIQALALAEQRWPEDNIEKVLVRSKYAGVLMALGEWKEAEQVITKVIEFNRQAFGNDHPDLAHDLEILAVATGHSDPNDPPQVRHARGAESIRLWKETLRIREQVYKSDHREIMRSLAGTAHYLRFENHIDEALRYSDRAIEMAERLKLENSDLASAYLTRSECREWNRDLPGAISDAQHAVDIFLAVNDQLNLADAQQKLAAFLSGAGRLDEAEQTVRAALKSADESPFSMTIAQIRIRHTLAEILADKPAGQEEREQLLNELIDLCEKYPGTLPSHHTMARVSLSNLCRQQGKLAAALRHLERGQHVATEFPDRVVPWLPEYLELSRGLLLADLRRFEEAEPILVASFVRLERERGVSDPECQQVRKRLASLLSETDRADLASELMNLTPEAPPAPAPLATSDDDLMVLRIAAPRMPHRWVQHAATRWQIREAGDFRTPADYETNPTLDVTTTGELTELQIPPGLFAADRPYSWRAFVVATDGRQSQPSVESSLITPNLESIVESIDLSRYFNRDVVADFGDTVNDSIDGDADSLLAVDGFDGSHFDAENVNGLPLERRVGDHLLGAYGGHNALQLTSADHSVISILLPAAPTVAFKFLVTGANGATELPITVHFQDQTAQRVTLRCPDWFSERMEQASRPYASPRLNGMDRIREGKLDDANDPALFEIVVQVERQTPVTRIDIHPAEAEFATTRTTCNLFSLCRVIRSQPLAEQRVASHK